MDYTNSQRQPLRCTLLFFLGLIVVIGSSVAGVKQQEGTSSSWRKDYERLMSEDAPPLKPAATLKLLKRLEQTLPPGNRWEKVNGLLKLDRMAADADQCDSSAFDEYDSHATKLYEDKPNPRIYARYQAKRHYELCLKKFYTLNKAVDYPLTLVSRDDRSDLTALFPGTNARSRSQVSGETLLAHAALALLKDKNDGNLAGAFKWPTKKSSFDKAFKRHVVDLCARVTPKLGLLDDVFQGLELVASHFTRQIKTSELEWVQRGWICQGILANESSIRKLAYSKLDSAKKSR